VQEAVLVAAGDRLAQAIFPHSGVISLVVRLSAGETVEVGMIGRDSVFGAAAALDGGISLTDAVVQLSGIVSTLDIERLRTVANQSATFRTRLIRHEQALFAQAQQSAACNASHSAESRLARCLLRLHDLAEVEDLPLTQDSLAQMIGVKRNSVSLVAHILQEAGLIKYGRGHIRILNIDGLKNNFLRMLRCGQRSTHSAAEQRLGYHRYSACGIEFPCWPVSTLNGLSGHVSVRSRAGFSVSEQY
jgi:CRP-like cAMP-binding protein